MSGGDSVTGDNHGALTEGKNCESEQDGGDASRIPNRGCFRHQPRSHSRLEGLGVKWNGHIRHFHNTLLRTIYKHLVA